MAVEEIAKYIQNDELEPMDCDPLEEDQAMGAIGGLLNEDWAMDAEVLEEATYNEDITSIYGIFIMFM